MRLTVYIHVCRFGPKIFFRAFYLFRVEREDEPGLNKEKVLFIPPPSQHSLHAVGKSRFCVLEAITVFLLTLCCSNACYGSFTGGV